MSLDPIDYLQAAPSYLAVVGGIIYLWTIRRRSPRAAGLAIGGLVALLGLSVTREWGDAVLYHFCMEQDGLFGLQGWRLFRLSTTVVNVVQACCWLLVVCAVMVDRRRTEPPGGHPGS